MIAKIQPLALLIGRVVLGVVLIAHGWEKWSTYGIEGTAQGFEAMGIPAPQTAAYFAAIVEFGGGILLILGAALPVVGVLMVGNFMGALYYAHLANGFWVIEGGYEFVMILAAFGLVIGFSGGGALSVDKLFTKKKDQSDADATTAVDSSV